MLDNTLSAYYDLQAWQYDNYDPEMHDRVEIS